MIVIEEGIEMTTISAAIWRTDSATGAIGVPYWLGFLWGGHGTTCASAEMSMAYSVLILRIQLLKTNVL